MSDVKVGQIWKEVDPRFERYIEVIYIDDVTQKVEIVSPAGSGGQAGRRTTKASIKRFNGKRGGYVLHKDAS